MLVSSLLLTLSIVTYSQTATVKETLPNGEYIVTINNIDYRAITSVHVKAIEISELEASKVPSLQQQIIAMQQLIDLQKQQLQNLQKLANINSKLTNLDTSILSIYSSIESVRVQQHQDATALLKSVESVEVAGKGTWFDRLMDKVPIKIGVTALGAVANGRSAFSPCH